MKTYLYVAVIAGAVIIGGGIRMYQDAQEIKSLTHENQELRRLVEIDNDIFKDLGDTLMNVLSVFEEDNIFSMAAAMSHIERDLARNAKENEARKAEREDLYETLFEERE